jgi:DeoR/GlpR family transcriptional regulator of sugar metabolism
MRYFLNKNFKNYQFFLHRYFFLQNLQNISELLTTFSKNCMSAALLKNERKDLILRQINIHTRVTFGDLSRLTNVSEDTIRRDLHELAAEGKILKIRGGAMVNTYHPNAALSDVYAQDSKASIAQKAISLLHDDMLVLIGGGTTVREFIRLIPNELRATFLTVNPFTVMELSEKPNLESIMIGGKISKFSQMAIGAETIQMLNDIKADLCILGTNALSVKEGLTDNDWDTVQVKKSMIRAADKTAIIAISEKLDTSMRLKVCDLKDLTYLITELDPKDPILTPYTEGVVLV